jgi:hypothetical protein
MLMARCLNTGQNRNIKIANTSSKKCGKLKYLVKVLIKSKLH